MADWYLTAENNTASVVVGGGDAFGPIQDIEPVRSERHMVLVSILTGGAQHRHLAHCLDGKHLKMC